MTFLPRVQRYAGANNMTFIILPHFGETWYYYAVITQADSNRIITSPICLTSPQTLPIVLSDFSGILKNGKGLLQWVVEKEVNALHYIIKRLITGEEFEQIGYVKATGASTYSFTDNSPVEGANYYRLKQVDKDGKSEYSKVVSINVERENIVPIFPNPTKGSIRIKTGGLTGKVLIQVVDAAGNMVYNNTLTSNPILYINLSQLPSGTYAIRVNDSVSKLVISK